MGNKFKPYFITKLFQPLSIISQVEYNTQQDTRHKHKLYYQHRLRIMFICNGVTLTC